jgi:heme-degrading monooxygenase HmoA
MIQVHVDLAVAARKEQEMLAYFRNVFRPAAMKFRGYIDVRMLKLRSAPVGTPPPGINYRFAITYETEELRQKWVTSDVHTEVWGGMEKMLSDATYTVLLFDAI